MVREFLGRLFENILKNILKKIGYTMFSLIVRAKIDLIRIERF